MDISGTVQNFGSNNITDFDLVYTINGTDVSTTYSVSGIDIAYGETYYFTHDVQYDFATADTYTVEVEISNVNGGVDENAENDVLSIDVDAAEGVVQRKPLNEVFTSSTCGYCPDDNANIDAITLDPANIDACTLIKYKVSWPGDGDPYQTPMAADRVSFYGITGVPAFFVDANEDAGDTYTQTDLDTYAAVPAFFEIDGEHTIVGDQVDIDVTITPNVNFTGVCHVVVVEKETTGNIGTNGETEFHNVMMAMLPTSAGTTVDLTAGVPYNFSVSKDMSDTFVEETYDCEVVMFLQNPGTQEVMQSNYSVLNNTGSDLILTDVEVVSTITDCVYSDASEIQVTLYNYGVDDITEFDVQYIVDGGVPVTETVTYTILAGDTYTYTFPTTVDLSALGVHEITAECSFASDVYTENNSGETSVLSGDDAITIDITFDDYPGETSWDLVYQATSTVIAEGSLYTGTSTSEEICILSTSCYTFTIYDAYGDGICCSYGSGSYTVTRGCVVMASGGEFGASESSDISIPIDITLDDITICPGETITFPAVGMGTYDVDAVSIDNNTPATTTVTYTIEEGGVCEVSETFDVIVLDDALDITPEDITVCKGEAITFLSGVGTFDTATVSNTTVAVTTVTYSINEGTTCESSTTFDVTVLEAPEAVITEEADFTLTTTSTDDIQWYLDYVLIDGETGQSYVCTADGDYYAIMSNANCSTQSNTITITGTFAELFSAEGLNVFPNPTDSKLYVEFKEYSELTVKVLDYTGKTILERNINSGEYIDVSELAAGVYFVDVKNMNNEGGMYKIVVE
ncbi:MAG: hypothetical protein C0596_07680 [Marinilabiliales bacterium]|nr:MAG: hypothetical protein C0596_07680 [Marinilabiliales bacterium]